MKQNTAMRKTLALTLALGMPLSLAACGSPTPGRPPHQMTGPTKWRWSASWSTLP